MAEPIRWGILGTGYAARQFASDLRYVPDAQLVAVGSRELSRAQNFAGRFSGCRPMANYEQLANAPDIDVVYIATTADRHPADCMLCLNAGRPVLCEKPFAVDACAAREAVELARSKNLFCMEAMWMRFQPLIQKTRELIRAGAIGDVHQVTADFGVPAERTPNNRLFDPRFGGGAVLDRGVYGLSLAFFLLGEPTHVSSEATIGPTGVDEQSSVLLQYSTGELAVLSSSLTTYTSNEAWIVGTTGRIVIHEPFYRPHRISISHRQPVERSHNDESAVADGGLKHNLIAATRGSRNKMVRSMYHRLKDCLVPLVKRPRSILLPPVGNGFNYEAAEVGRCLRAGILESPWMPLDETLRILETIDTARSLNGQPTASAFVRTNSLPNRKSQGLAAIV